ncbi:Heterokaryon incompatibility protein 6, OR allele [Pseudocercospora fuligena]|uniref:Heterokaryon incompatibility protein 6, OR allele n=1 Tax=Pseudocercospora fuligena TaxID=685502 RepID=A0A8H6VP70_9PEZI|nr:Heterokaryon incompatibility protein 6, OR allele [Pseudocercospora fuligena]
MTLAEHGSDNASNSRQRISLQALRSITSPAIRTKLARRRTKLQPFHHEPLTDPTRQIRLLRILPESTDTQLRLRLETHDLVADLVEDGTANATSSFVAVSYMWGIKTRLQSIIVNGQSLDVTADCRYSLWQAFRCPLVQQDGHIWVDSICINQRDLAEKSAQVKIMGSIYRKATSVLACTGNHGDDSEYVFEVLNDLQATRWPWQSDLGGSLQDRLGFSSTDDEAYSRFVLAFQDFEQRAYWNRLWIVPELSLAKSITILCGSDSLPLGAVDDPKSFYHGLLDIARQVGKAVSEHDDLPMTKLLCSISGETLHRYKNRGATDRGYSLLVALSEFHSWQCTDTRDRVYAFLEIVKWPPRLPRIVPDYTITCAELAKRLVPMAMIEGWHIAAKRQDRDLKLIFQQALQLTDSEAIEVWQDVDAAAVWKYYCQSGNEWHTTGYSEALRWKNGEQR